MNWLGIDWQAVIAFSPLVIAISSLAGLLAILFIIWQVLAMREERLESLYDFLVSEGNKLSDGLEDKGKVEEIEKEKERTKLRRKYHLYLERIEEALRIEKAPFWSGTLKQRYKRLQAWYWTKLRLYGEGKNSEPFSKHVFKEVRCYHDYTRGEPDPMETGYIIVSELLRREEETKQEKYKMDLIVNPIICSLKDILGEQYNDLLKKKTEENLNRRVQELEEIGFIKIVKKAEGKIQEIKLGKGWRKAIRTIGS